MQTALITGAARRVGAHLAVHLARQGVSVALHYNASDGAAAAVQAKIHAAGGNCALFQADLNDPAQVPALFAAVRKAMGPVDLLINNASRFVNDDFTRIDAQALHQHMNVNLLAPVLLIEAMAAQPEPAVDRLAVNMLDNKLFALNPDFFTYTLSKVALQAATQMGAMRFAGQPRVCGIAPGITLISGKQSEENFQKSSRINPLQRQAGLEDLAHALDYLWQAKGTNGEVLVVDGGQTLWQLPRDVAFLTKEGLIDG